MRAVIQRVSQCSVSIDASVHSSIDQGLLILLGIEHDDTEQDATWLANKISILRIFSDADGLMNKSAIDSNAELMIVSQFTLHASTKKGARPSFIKAAKPQQAIPLYEAFIRELASKNLQTATGEFGANMQVSLINDGPVTISLDTKNKE